jgi:hypothetical protein
MITYQQKVLSMLEAKLAIYDFQLVDRGMHASNVSTLSIQQPGSLHEYGYIWFNFQSGYFDIDVYRCDLRRPNVKPTLLSSARHVEAYNIDAFTCLVHILTAYLASYELSA